MKGDRMTGEFGVMHCPCGQMLSVPEGTLDELDERCRCGMSREALVRNGRYLRADIDAMGKQSAYQTMRARYRFENRGTPEADAPDPADAF